MLFEASFNSQNIPEDMRDLWTSDDSEHVLLQADWSQIEARWTAFFAQDVKMTTAFFDGADLHSMMAAKVYGCPATKKEADAWMIDPATGLRSSTSTTSARYICKRVRHGRNFGMEKKKMSLVTGIPEATCARLIVEDRDMWPTTARWQEVVVEEAIRKRVLDTPFGRRRRFNTPPPVDWQNRSVFAWADAREAMSFRPQSSAASMLKQVMGELRAEVKAEHPALLPHLLWASTHDSITLHVHKAEVKGWAIFLKRHMERPFPEAVWLPFYPKGFFVPISLKYGYTWSGELGEIKLD